MNFGTKRLLEFILVLSVASLLIGAAEIARGADPFVCSTFILLGVAYLVAAERLHRKIQKEQSAMPVPANVVEIMMRRLPMETIPNQIPEPESLSATAIGKAVTIVGSISTREDLEIHGRVEGSVESLNGKITIAPGGCVKATIRAGDIVILGQVQGNVEAGGKVELRKDGKLVGDITTSRIWIEDGAVFQGSIDIRTLERKPIVIAAQGELALADAS